MLKAKKPAFGVTSEKNATADSDEFAKDTGCRPMWRGVYASIGAPFELSRLSEAAGTPFLTVQPKQPGKEVNQKSWSLAAIIAGKRDAEFRGIADTIVEYGDLVVIRYAPEMNGNWSPWAADVNGNTPGEYREAWRHVVELFRKAGATNVLWLWAPNIARGATVQGISQFWPGDDYVDLVGFTGYGVGSSVYGFEPSASETFDPTMELLAPYKKKTGHPRRDGCGRGPQSRVDRQSGAVDARASERHRNDLDPGAAAAFQCGLAVQRHSGQPEGLQEVARPVPGLPFRRLSRLENRIPTNFGSGVTARTGLTFGWAYGAHPGTKESPWLST
ncbi:glycosyl hydrolase family 26 [Couchioplanes caeruleus]|uniref:Glycosyl hydrolase family 26 n=2 Tax=Couchioplanes caeruleus TaxID=56438 RepID=A0A3N1GII4_9ACTN|nr:glycosyl hydrolase family 26 [Couchioplanes caeruleus]